MQLLGGGEETDLRLQLAWGLGGRNGWVGRKGLWLVVDGHGCRGGNPGQYCDKGRWAQAVSAR